MVTVKSMENLTTNVKNPPKFSPVLGHLGCYFYPPPRRVRAKNQSVALRKSITPAPPQGLDDWFFGQVF